MERRDRFSGRFDEVLQNARTGERAALEMLFSTLSPAVHGYLRLQGSVEPEDLTSEAFLGVLRNLSTFTGGEQDFRAWVFTIAHRRLLDERRRLRRKPPPQPLDDMPEPPAPDDVEETASRLLADESVRELCERLVPDQRDVLLLRLLGGLTIDEVAAALGKTPGAVKALQRRGFTAILRQLAPEGVAP